MITPKLKDEVLNWLCLNLETEKFYTINAVDLQKILGLSFETLNSVLLYFKRIGFISELNSMRHAIHFILHIEANDFLLRGGFVVQEELFENNIKKLLLEIDNLKNQLGSDQLDTANKLSSIASALFSGLSLLHK